MSAPLKLAYVLTRFPVVSETFVASEIAAMCDAGVDVRIYTLLPPRPQERAMLADVGPGSDRVDDAAAPSVLRSLPAVWSNPADRDWYLARCPRRARQRLWAMTAYIRVGEITERAAAWGATHVHAHFAGVSAAAAALVARRNGATCSFTAHAFDIYTRDAESLAQLTSSVTFAATISEANLEHLRGMLPAAAVAKYRLVRCGIDVDRFAAAGSPGEGLVAVGRLVPKKGFLVLIEALAQLAAAGRHVRCRIIGEGSQRAALARAIRRHGLEAHVTLDGACAHDDVQRAIRGSAAFVLPCVIGHDGDRDGIPVSLMEAMAMERPVITTRLPGIMELVRHEDTGLLADPGDPAALAEAITRALDGHENAAMGGRARAHVVAAFDTSANARKLLRLITEAAAGR